MFKIYAIDKKCLPERSFRTDAGIDLRVANSVTLKHNEPILVGCGIHLEIEPGYVGLIFPRSGMATKHGITLTNTVGVIDADYRGEIMCSLVYNARGCSGTYTIGKYDRVAQLVTVPIMPHGYHVVESLEELSVTDRGVGGFGSTGNG